MTSLGGVSVLSVMTTPDKAYRWWYRDPLTKILFKGTFAKIGVRNLRWTNYAGLRGPVTAPAGAVRWVATTRSGCPQDR
jgi:NAD(P)H dehydrogenase (quinone)